ncbi:HTH-type transcriptional activator RhaR [Mycovorax composti]|jgi:AraC-type DNA-binding domain-containing proteins|uniref:HTH-type transcriptional activator RhaR n=2 Tax=Chitinophagaceae TaxID=563835 RepID=A0ABZ2EJF2_9BACT
MHSIPLFKSDLKTLGIIKLDETTIEEINNGTYKQFIRVLYIPKGYSLQIDLSSYKISRASLFFVNTDQYLYINKSTREQGYLIFYNRDFYCIQIHDHEVACDGILFNNIHNIPFVQLPSEDQPYYSAIFEDMLYELEQQQSSQEEMLRTYLKQLFIKAARLWKQQHLHETLSKQPTDVEFFRKFTLLVEKHYKEKHNVADYAAMLFMAPKTLTHKFKKLNLPQPNEIIKNRILLEAKRLLVHTDLTAKEIGYELGYDDPAYFSRLFLQKTGTTPSHYRTSFLKETN